MLGNTADTLDPGAVRGIAQLVASSVKGLKTDNVTITDSTGTLLWPAGDGSSGAAGVAAGKQALEARYARAMEADLNAMLVRTLGAGKAQVEVTADLNADKTTREKLTYAKKGVPLKTQTESEKLTGGGATTGGAAGTGSNIPTYSAGTAGGDSNSNYQRKSGTTDCGVDKKVDHTKIAAGAVNKLQRRAARRQVRPGRRLRLDPEGRRQRRGHRHHARRHDAGRPDAVRQGADAEGRPGPDHAARPAQVGGPRPRRSALPVLHDPRRCASARARTSARRPG